MTIIALIIFGFLLLAFAWAFMPRHQHGVNKILKQNYNVQPLFKERSAAHKYETLHEQLKTNPAQLQTLEQLHADYKDKLITVDAYYEALEALEQQQIKH